MIEKKQETTGETQKKKVNETYTVEKAEQINKYFAELPPAEKSAQKLSKQELIYFLKNSIIDVQSRGYTIDHIIDSLHDQGVTITKTVFKNYLARAKARDIEKNKKQNEKKATQKKNSKKQDTPPGTTPLVFRPNEDNSRRGKGSFEVDEDTKEI